MMTQLNCSPCTSTPCQKLDVANSTAFGVSRKRFSKTWRGADALQQHGESQPRRQQIVRLPHLLITGEQHKGPAARRFEYRARFHRRRLRQKAGLARIGQLRRNVKQNLFRVIEGAFDGKGARVRQPQPALCVFEFAIHGQSRGSENDGLHLVHQAR